MHKYFKILIFVLTATLLACGGRGGGGANAPLEVRFAAVSDGQTVGCSSKISGLGPNQNASVGISDLRFFVSDVVLYDKEGNPLETEIDFNDFQYKDSGGSVALIDLTDNTGGTCADTAISFAEGTARTNSTLSLLTEAEKEIGAISFSVGVPQRLMKETIANYTAEDAPSPLGELFWSWASGYRHFVLNFQVERAGEIGDGYIHIGSRDCGGNGAQALLDREECGLLNTPKVMLQGFDPSQNEVTIDVRRVLQGLSFVADVYDTEPPFDLVGQDLGVACHSAPAESQPDCAPIFESFGLDLATGRSQPDENSIFSFR
jgi:uncharacterized repeat protein (TIGR04052 family)